MGLRRQTALWEQDQQEVIPQGEDSSNFDHTDIGVLVDESRPSVFLFVSPGEM